MAIYIGSEEEEYKKVLKNDYLMDLLLDGYGAEPIDEYGPWWLWRWTNGFTPRWIYSHLTSVVWLWKVKMQVE